MEVKTKQKNDKISEEETKIGREEEGISWERCFLIAQVSGSQAFPSSQK
jgi:hypothetical protein